MRFKPLKRQSQLQQQTFINTFSLFFREIRLDVSDESSAMQIKIKPYFIQKIKVKN